MYCDNKAECQWATLIIYNISSGNGLVLLGYKPLSESMVSHICHHMASLVDCDWKCKCQLMFSPANPSHKKNQNVMVIQNCVANKFSWNLTVFYLCIQYSSINNNLFSPSDCQATGYCPVLLTHISAGLECHWKWTQWQQIRLIISPWESGRTWQTSHFSRFKVEFIKRNINLTTKQSTRKQCVFIKCTCTAHYVFEWYLLEGSQLVPISYRAHHLRPCNIQFKCCQTPAGQLSGSSSLVPLTELSVQHSLW